MTWMSDLTPDSEPADVDRAKGVCGTCPALADCRRWIDGLPPHQRPAGVVAGDLLGPPPAAPKPRRDPDAEDTWLRAYLGRHRGRAVAEQVIVAGRAADIPEARLRAARRRIGAKVNTSTGPTWYLPDTNGEEVAS